MTNYKNILIDYMSQCEFIHEENKYLVAEKLHI